MSYIAILVIPIIVFCSILIQETHKVNQREMIRVYENDTKKISDAIDSRLIEFNKIGDRLYRTKWLNKLMSSSTIFEKEFSVLRKIEISDELNNYLVFSNFLSNIAIVYPDKDLVVSYNGWHSTKGYFNLMGINDQIDINNIVSNMSSYSNYRILDSNNSSVTNYITIIQSMELIEAPRATLLIFVDLEYLTTYIEQLARFDLNELNIYNENKVLLKYQVKKVDEDNVIPEAEDNNKNKFTVISNIHPLRYECIYDNPSTTIQLDQIVPLLFACILSLFSGVLVAFILAKITYRPLHRLVSKIFNLDELKKNERKRMKSLNEYKLIEASFDKLVIDKENTLLRIKQYENAAKSNLLHRLIRGYFEEDVLIHRLQDLGIDYSDYMFYCVVLIRDKLKNQVRKPSNDGENTDYKEYMIGITATQEQKRLSLLMMIANILDNSNLDCQLLDFVDDDIAVIFSFVQNINIESNIKEIIHNIRLKIKVLDIQEPMIVVGNIEKGLIGISKSYQTAKESMEHALFGVDMFGNPNTIAEDNFYYYPTDWEIQLVNNLKVGNFDTVTKIIDEIKLENEDRQLSTDSMKRLILLLMETIIRVLNELNISIGIYQREFNEIMLSEDLSRAWSYIYEVSNRVCERSNYFNDSNDVNIGDVLLQYVNDNFSYF
jgi:hypothetical protein